MQMKDKIAVITGGASGIGEATLRRFVGQQVKVAVFDVNGNAGEALVRELGNDNVAYYQVDVCDETQTLAAVRATVRRFGGAHICCNYAGVLLPAKTIGRDGVCDLQSFIKTVQVNLVGTFNVTRLVADVMRNNPDEGGCRGVIINTASVAAFEGQAGQAAYSASKAGIAGMTLPLARDLARWGIRVNTIAPGIIHTPMFNGVKEEIYQSLQQQVLSPKRLGDPDEVAHLAQTIVENDYINAACLRLDGGIRMQAS